MPAPRPSRIRFRRDAAPGAVHLRQLLPRARPDAPAATSAGAAAVRGRVPRPGLRQLYGRDRLLLASAAGRVRAAIGWDEYVAADTASDVPAAVLAVAPPQPLEPQWEREPDVGGQADEGPSRLEVFRATLLSRAALADLPQPEPLIKDTIDRRTVALLEGRNSTGKSFLALDWACCVATGRPWQGREVQRGRVLYLAAEGAYGLHNRVTAWEAGWRHQVPPERFTVRASPVNLFTGRDCAELIEVVHADGYDLVVVDTWARSTVGGHENDNSDSTQAFVHADAMRKVGATVLVVHHTDKADSGGRGASALEDNADTIYRIKGDDGYLELTREKRKDGACEDRHQLQLAQIMLPHRTPDGTEYATSCVLQNTRGQDHSLAPRAEALMSVFTEHFADMGCSKAELRAVADMPPATFARSLKALVEQGLLHNTRSDSTPFYKRGPTP